ncbi:response regulator transcription factor [bacterium]|nr:response regulator transcription factor [bacterium]
MKITVLTIEDFQQFQKQLETFIEANPQIRASFSEIEIEQQLISSMISSNPTYNLPDADTLLDDDDKRKRMLLIEKNDSAISPEQTYGEELTEREYDVLEKVANGESNPQIAENLNITVNTVKTHLRQILAKLNVENRTQAATYAIKSGMITLDC